MLYRNLEVSDLPWRTSRHSAGNGACVEAASASWQILVRDSVDRGGPVIRHSSSSWQAFIAAVKAGVFDSAQLGN